MRWLAIEMSTARGSLAVVADGAVEREVAFDAMRGQSSALFPTLAELARTGRPVDGVLVGLGPGSFAGLRVAVAAATGYARWLGISVAGAPSPLGVEGGADFWYVGDARRGKYHCTRVRAGTVLEGPVLIDPPDLARLVPSGSGGAVFGPAPLPELPGLVIRVPSAAQLVLVAADRVAVPPDPESGTLEPLYLREASVTPPRAGPGR